MLQMLCSLCPAMGEHGGPTEELLFSLYSDTINLPNTICRWDSFFEFALICIKLPCSPMAALGHPN